MELKNVTIKSIGQLKTFDSGFSIVEFVVTTDEQYPQTLQLQANKEKAENLIKFNKVGDKVDCSINLRGREWINPEGVAKYFNSIQGWRIEKLQAGAPQGGVPPVEAIDAFEPADKVSDNEPDDLPF